MLFKARFHAGIRHGKTTLSFRRWRRPRVGPGRRYRVGGLGTIEVTAVDRVGPAEIDDQAARQAGFEGRAELLGFLKPGEEMGVAVAEPLFRVAFRYLGPVEPPSPPAGDPSEGEIEELAERLRASDRRSRRGPWTGQILALVGEHPRRRAADLAERLGWELPPFKTNARKLKLMGLLDSHEVGYELTELGRQVGERLRRLPSD